jgi:hypothetical protein
VSRSPENRPIDWYGVIGLAMLGVLIAFGFVAKGLIFGQALVALGFAAGVLLLARLWQRTLGEAKATPPLTPGQWALNLGIFAAELGVMLLLAIWWNRAGRDRLVRHGAFPANAGPISLPAPDDDRDGPEGGPADAEPRW